MRFFVRFHYLDSKPTGATVFSNFDSALKLINNYLPECEINKRAIYVSIEDTLDGSNNTFNIPLFWRN